MYSITSNLPPSKLPGQPAMTSVSFDMSKGNDVDGLWNSGPAGDVDSLVDEQIAADGGDGLATVDMPEPEAAVVEAMPLRTKSNPQLDPLTGAELRTGKVMWANQAPKPMKNSKKKI